METTEREYVTVKEFLDAVDGRLSKNLVYTAIKMEAIPSVRIGRRILLPADALDQMLKNQSQD